MINIEDASLYIFLSELWRYIFAITFWCLVVEKFISRIFCIFGYFLLQELDIRIFDPILIR